jgi:RNase P subunit RPR2
MEMTKSYGEGNAILKKQLLLPPPGIKSKIKSLTCSPCQEFLFIPKKNQNCQTEPDLCLGKN